MDYHISIHKALAGLDSIAKKDKTIAQNFNPQGPRGPRRSAEHVDSAQLTISIHKALAGLDAMKPETTIKEITISIHKALAGLDAVRFLYALASFYFNPQGPRGPRPVSLYSWKFFLYFNPQGPRGPRLGC